MRKYKLVGAKEPEEWAWDENPIPNKEYTILELKKMHGSVVDVHYDSFEDIFENWEDEDWEENHGKWIEVL